MPSPSRLPTPRPVSTQLARRRPHRPVLELLEDRLVPATTWTVNSTADAGSGDALAGDLRYCITQANQDPGSTIVFDPAVFATGQAIVLQGSELPVITEDLTIQGPAAVVTIDGNHQSRVFEIGDATHNPNVSLSSLSVTGGVSTGNGGGILDNSTGTLALASCTVSGNSALQGGGLSALTSGTVTAQDCAFSNNAAVVAGGLFDLYGKVTLTGCTLSGNSVNLRCGGLENFEGTVSLTDCTLSGNYGADTGGGIANYYGTTILLNCTVADNATAYTDNPNSGGGGIYLVRDTGQVKLTNTIVAGNLFSGSPDQIKVDAGSLTGAFNLIGAGENGGLADGVNHNRVGVADPMLAPLGDYGGATPTRALLPGSPALGVGDPQADGLPATDQRGFARKVNGLVDIGAFETQPAAVDYLVTTAGDPGEFGKQSLRGALDLANLLGGNPTITFDPSAFATPQTILLGAAGQIPITASVTIRGPAAGVTVSGNQRTGVFQIGDRTHNPDVTVATLTITQGTGSPNPGASGTSGGGIYDVSTGTLTLSGCTVSDNSATFGGGIEKESGSLTLVNCTVADNTATQGGGLRLGRVWATLTNTTVSGNLAYENDGGGGLYNFGFSATLNNTVVDGNDNFNQYFPNDLAGGAGATGSNNVIGVGSGGLQNGVNGNQVGVAAGLAPLGNYGGPTPTMVPLPGSPALGAGSVTLAVDQNDNPLTTDQRGFARTRNGAVDVGAVETRGFTFTITGGDSQSTPINTDFPQALAVQLLEGSGATAVGLPGVEVDFAGPGSGPDLTTTPSATTDTNGNAAVMVTANGTTGAYTVTATASGLTATFHLSNVEAPGLVVTTAQDVVDPFDNQTSLREAIAYANTFAADTTPAISFDPTAFAAAQTISLNGTELPVITHDLTLTGPSAGVTVRGNLQSRVFEVGGNAHAALSNLTVSGGRVQGDGAGILIDAGGSLALANCTLSGNSAQSRGGGLDNGGTAALTDCILTGNVAYWGGAVFNVGPATLTDCTLAGNAAGEGGGLQNFSALRLSDCTLSGNSASNYGGGLDNFSGTATLTDCTLAGNATSITGGGMFARGGSVALTNCTLAGNAAGYGGGLASSGAATLANCVVAGNAADNGPDVYWFSGSPWTVTASYSLVGDGSGSSLTATAANHNQVGTAASPIDPLLAPLGNYGGPTPTMALLPGSPALDAGDSTSAPATDQRGENRVNAPDLGAFESQGFTLTVQGGDNQRANPNTAFGAALVVGVTANNAAEPVQNGLVTFTAPAGGATGTFGGSATAVVKIAADGTATAPTFTANGTLGSYTVSAAAAGSAPTVLFNLTNADTLPPTVTAAGLVNVTAGGATSYGFTVTFADNVALDVSTLQTGNVTVSGPGGFTATPIFVGVDNTANGTPRTATYAFTPPGGYWDLADNGTYTVCLTADQVKDTSGNAAAATSIGSFTVNVTKAFAAVINGNLVVAGTNGNDSLTISYANNTLAVQLNGTTQTFPAAPVTGHVIVNGYGGNDRLSMMGLFAAEFHAGSGTDVIHGGDGGNVICGGSGTLTAYAGAGNDVLVGGAGKATLYGGRGHAVLIGGNLKAGMGFDGYAQLAAQWAAGNTTQEAALRAAVLAGAADTLYAGTGGTWGFAAAANDFMGFLTAGTAPRDRKTLLS